MKKALLALLPAFMLCSCAGNPLQFVEDAIEDNGWANVLEDNELHEEIFNKAPISFGERKNAYTGDIGLGVQVASYKKEATDYRAIRFIAAITLDDVADVSSAVWTRAVWQSGGGVRKASDTKASTSAYTSLYDGKGDLYGIDDYNDANGTSHTHFVVYTLYDIPNTTYDYDYVTAYITVDTKVSRVAASTINAATQFVFDKTELDSDHYFGVKKTSSGWTDVVLDTPTGTNHAQKANFSLGVDDKFMFVHYVAGTTFLPFGDYNQHSGDPFVDGDGTSNFLVSNYVQVCNFYLNGSDEIWIDVLTVTKTFYLLPDSNWTSSSARFALNGHNNSDKDVWVELTDAGEGYYSGSLTFDPARRLIFCRMNPDGFALDWGKKWNQTQDMTYTHGKNLCTITIGDGQPWGDGSQTVGFWGTK